MINPNKLTLIDKTHTFLYTSTEGYFCVYNQRTKNANSIESCRELFHRKFKPNNMIGFGCLNLKIKKVNQFLERREEKLGIPPEERSELFETTIPNTIIFNLNQIWRKDATARSLITLLIRAAALNYSNNFDKCLDNYDLTADCKEAILWWLNGNTKPTFKRFKPLGMDNYTHDNTGFVYHFENRTKEEIEKLLIKPDNNEREKWIKLPAKMTN